LLDETLIQKVWSQHLQGTLNAGHDLWGVLMFQGWHQKWHGGTSDFKMTRADLR